MKYASAILRSVILSTEFFLLVLFLATYVLYPAPFTWLSGQIATRAELLKYLGFLPAGLVVYDAKLINDILFPGSDKGTVLQGWPEYWNFKCVVCVGLLYGFIFAVGGISVLLLDWEHHAAHHSAILIASVVGSLVTSLTLYFAHIKVEELFRERPIQARTK